MSWWLTGSLHALGTLRLVGFQDPAYEGPAPEGTLARKRAGRSFPRGEFANDEIPALREEIQAISSQVPADDRAGRSSRENAERLRYERFHRSALRRRTITRRAIQAPPGRPVGIGTCS